MENQAKQPNKFSVIIPTFQRQEKLSKAISSVVKQTYCEKNSDCVEIIVVADGCTDGTHDYVPKLTKTYKNLIYIHKHREQRLIARNVGMRAARFPWICWMDDDDEMYPEYLSTFSKMIDENPAEDVFQCAVRFGKDIDGVFKEFSILKPKELEHIDFEDNEDTFQHDTKLKKTREHFTSGCITTGQFIFRKGCLETVGYLPHTNKYGDFAIDSGIPGYGWRPPEGRFKEKRVQVLGNPWGDDFYLFYKLTRYFNVKNTQSILFKKNCR